MNKTFVWIFILSVSGAQCLKKTTFVDLIAEDFHNDDWAGLNETCRYKMLEVFNGAKNFTLWATWVLDSLQIMPQGFFYDVSHQMSNYDQCTFTPWTETHPELEMKFRSVAVFLNKDGKIDKHVVDALEPYGSASAHFTRRHFAKNIKDTFLWSFCLPPSCNLREIERIAEIFFSRSHLAHRANDAKIVGVGCNTKKESGYLIWFALLILIGSIFSSTYIYKTKMFSEDKRVMGIAKSLSIYENWKLLTNTDRNNFDVLNGIKCICSVVVISLHISLINMIFGISNSLIILEYLTKPPTFIGLSLFMVVDSFFAMSGMIFTKQMLDKIGDPENPLKTIFKRYVRLAPLSIFAMLIQVINSTNSPSGPSTCVIENYLKVCKNWWLEATLIPRYFGIYEHCQLALWSTFVDFELTAIITFLLILFRKNRKLGIFSMLLFFVYGMTKTAHLTLYRNVQSMVYIRREEWMDEIKNHPFFILYLSTEGRIAPYLVGVAAGFLVHFYKPRDYKNYLSKRTSKMLVVSSITLSTSILYWVASTNIKTFSVPDMFLSVLVNCTHKGTFAFSTVLLIIACLYGNIPTLKYFLSSKLFRILGRLTYAVYIVHVPLIFMTVSHNRGPAIVEPVKLTVDIIGYTVLAYSLAVIAHLMIEAPARNLVFYLLFDRERTKTSSNVKTNSSIHKNILSTQSNDTENEKTK